MEIILEQAKKVAQAAELFVVSSQETPIHFEANRLKHIQSKHSNITALRIIRKGRIGYSVTTKLNNIGELIV